MKKKLSICIPTYNRQNFLKRLLDNCIKETTGIENLVEVCVSDNGSTDGTENLVKEYCKKYKFIKYQKNKKNLGFDKNVICVLEMAKSKYCWLIGDDDLFLKDSMNEVITIIKSEEPDFIIAEYYHKIFTNYVNWNGPYTITNPKLIRETFIEKLADISFLSSNIIKKRLFLKIKNKIPENTYGYMHRFIQLYALNYIKKLCITENKVVFETCEGDFPTKKTRLEGQLKYGYSARYFLKKGIINKGEYLELMNNQYRSLAIAVIFYDFAIKEEGASKEELERMRKKLYQEFIKGTPNDDWKLCLSFLIIKKRFLVWMFKMGYVFIYVKFMNIFRKDKKEIVWELWKKNRALGGRDTCF